ncbi:MAG TPA: PD-(D/E)XK nuclease family protein, partial [Candidatus Polarisedimenticolia bacterium]|nr:PD-(D/E)XK nuclease family protein [Candidatus Polarisedimenticolia bacterium]
RLQMALYALLAESLGDPGRVAVEVLGVGPGFDPDDPAARARLDPETFERFRPGLVETIDVLARLAGANLFPLDPESGRCDHCVYRRACRRTHPATLERLERQAALAEFRRLRMKIQRRPLLADLETGADEAES